MSNLEREAKYESMFKKKKITCLDLSLYVLQISKRSIFYLKTTQCSCSKVCSIKGRATDLLNEKFM